MVKSCLVATCKNAQGIPGITFHRIGKKRYANRLRAIGRSTDENLSPQNVICSKHFAVDDFIRFNGKKYLKLEALPRLFLPRRPSIEPKIDIKDNIPDKKNVQSTSNTLDIDKDIDSWLKYQDIELFIHTNTHGNLVTCPISISLIKFSDKYVQDNVKFILQYERATFIQVYCYKMFRSI